MGFVPQGARPLHMIICTWPGRQSHSNAHSCYTNLRIMQLQRTVKSYLLSTDTLWHRQDG
eukprot:4126223-Amphidinium_carterae.1